MIKVVNTKKNIKYTNSETSDLILLNINYINNNRNEN